MSCFEDSSITRDDTPLDCQGDAGTVAREKSESAQREEYLTDRGVVIEKRPSSSSPQPPSSSAELTRQGKVMEEEDRISWLRSKGVQIELAEDRYKKAPVADPNDLMTLTVVKIPCDERLPYSEVNISVLKRAQGDQIAKALAPFFSASTAETGLDEAMFFENAKKQLASQAVNVTKDTLTKVGQMGGAEAFPLSRPCPANNFKGVNLYVDEIGQLKTLQRNSRASNLASLCGYLDVPLVGDIYVGRVYMVSESASFGSIVHNESFPLSDLSSDSSWIKGAHAENYERGIQTNQVSMHDDKAALAEQHAKEKEVTGSGSAGGAYKWSETTENVEINYTFDKKISAKELKVVIKSNSVTVSNKSDVSLVYFAVPELFKGIRVDDSSWSISAVNGGSCARIDVTLDKVSPQFWGKLTK